MVRPEINVIDIANTNDSIFMKLGLLAYLFYLSIGKRTVFIEMK